MIRGLVVSVLAGMLGTAVSAKEIEGTWRLTTYEVEGRRVAAEGEMVHIRGSTVTLAGAEPVVFEVTSRGDRSLELKLVHDGPADLRLYVAR